jgi:hypothetical protein
VLALFHVEQEGRYFVVFHVEHYQPYCAQGFESQSHDNRSQVAALLFHVEHMRVRR